jgi:hypothetical protein
VQEYFVPVENKIYSVPLKIFTILIFVLLIYTLHIYTGAPILSLIITNIVIFILAVKNMNILETKGQLVIYVWLFCLNMPY